MALMRREWRRVGLLLTADHGSELTLATVTDAGFCNQQLNLEP